MAKKKNLPDLSKQDILEPITNLENLGSDNDPIKPIPGFPGYLITPDGVIYSYFKGKLYKRSYKENHKGYYTVHLKGHARKVHRLVALTYIPNPNNYPIVMHKDNNVKNNHVSNLQWGTQSMNMQQMVTDGRQRKSKVLLKVPLVLELKSQGINNKEIMLKLRLSKTSLYRILRTNNYGKK